MSKNKKSNNVNPEIAEQENASALSAETNEETSAVESTPVVEEKKNTDKASDKQKDKKVDNKKNQKNKKKDKKEKGKLKRKTKETLSELKKVTWPSFGEVCKKTGVVLVVVLIFAVVLFGIDYGLGALMRLLTGGK